MPAASAQFRVLKSGALPLLLLVRRVLHLPVAAPVRAVKHHFVQFLGPSVILPPHTVLAGRAVSSGATVNPVKIVQLSAVFSPLKRS
jgi:hypothetical protein